MQLVAHLPPPQQQTEYEQLISRAILYKLASNTVQSTATLNKAIALDKFYFLAHFNKASDCMFNLQERKAIDNLQFVLQNCPITQCLKFVIWGRIASALDKTNEAIAHYHKALEYEPNNFFANYYLGVQLINSNEFVEAIKVLQAAEENAGEYEVIRKTLLAEVCTRWNNLFGY